MTTGSRLPATSITRTVGRLVLGLFLIVAGGAHFVTTTSFLAQVPPWVPAPYLVVYVSGVIEIALGLALVLLPRWQRPLGWVVAAFFVIIVPGNIHQAVAGIDAFGLDTPTARWVRVAFQPLLVLWALWCTGVLTGGGGPREPAD
jgi:uncharacterized membrane protein